VATILVVDDRPSNRQFLTTLLGYGGHRMLEASDGARALELVRTERPELVITDILMPGMDGYEFVRQVREDSAVASTPVIFYTASYSTPQAEALAKSCGVRKVLSKPCEPETILAAVSQELGTAHEPAGPPPAVVQPDAVGDALALILKSSGDVQRRFEELARAGPAADVRDLSRKFADNVAGMQHITSRISALLEVGMEMTAERDPQRLVKLFFAACCDVIESNYAAIGMLGEDEKTIRFVFSKGVDASLFLAGDASRSGLARSLLDGHRVMRLHSGDGAPSAEGLPPGHPPVRSLLGIPVASAERILGWMYFADRRGEPGFSEEDTRLASIMTAKLALLYENAMLYDEIQRHAAKLQVESAERRRTEQALAVSEAGLRRAGTMARLGHVITGPDGSFESWSQGLPQLAGLAPGEMPASTREWLKLVHPDDQALFRNAAISAGVQRKRTDIEYRLRRGKEWIHVRQAMEPLDGEAQVGPSARWFNTLQDITEQKQSAAALQASEARYRTIFEQVAVGVVHSDLDGRLMEVNPRFCEISGYSRDEALRLSIQDLTHPEDIQKSTEARAALIAGSRAPYEREARLLRKDGARLWAYITTSLVRTAAGEARHFISVIQDISERKQAEIRIRRLNRVYAVLSQTNTLIVRVQQREELFRGACRIAIEQGGFRMAWIGLVDHGAGVVKPIASAGDVRDFFDAAPLTVLESKPGGHGLAGRAVREKQPMVSNDVRKDPQRLMRKELEGREINSLAVIPLIVGANAVGVLALYAVEAGFFDEEEMRLLVELASDIAFALDHIDKAEKLDYLAYYDPLTGLANRTHFHESVAQYIEAARRGGHKLALLVLDIDRFKTVNDSLGRDAGDELLRQVAQRMRSIASDPSSLARISADRFALVRPNVGSEAEIARHNQQKLEECFGIPYQLAGTEIRISAKVGIAMFPADGADADALFTNAEAALKKAKAAGERTLFYTQEMTERVAEKLALENKLRIALTKEEFVLHYQPKVDAEKRKIVGVEALIRWQSAEGLVPPGRFIPLMEETGIVREAGAWALRRAVLDHRHWLRMGIVAPRVAVNVSAVQLRQQDFVDTVKEAIAQGANPTGLDLEITESLIMEDVQGNIRKLKAIRDLGVSVAIDDFGTGYSSLAYLAKLPVETLKIDRSFIIGMLTDPNTMMLIQTMITLAHSLRLKVVAEGVETEEQAKMLRLLRCDELQGFLFSKPMPIEDVTPQLRERK